MNREPGIGKARKRRERDRQGGPRKVKSKKRRANVNKPEAELVELEVADAVNMAKASCVVEGQLT